MSAARSKPNDDVLVPPADLDAEAAVLSAVMLDATALPKVIDFLMPEHFFSEAHRRIFEAARTLFFAKDPVDSQTVASWLKARGRHVQVGGIPYIMSILDSTPVVANVRAHAVSVHDAWRRRQVMLVCQRLATQAASSVGDVQSWCEGTVRTFGEISMLNPVRPVETNEQALARILSDAFDGQTSTDTAVTPMTGFPTGIYGLDRYLGGLRRSAKTTISATTGVGKTALAIQVGVHVAKQAVGVLVFSTELKRVELLRRAVSCEADVDMSPQRLRRKALTEREKAALKGASLRIKGLPLRIDETARLTIEQVAGLTKSMQEEMLLVHRVPLGLVIFDYAQRSEASKHLMQRDRHEQIGHFTKGFKQLCQELDIAGVELAQAKDQDPRAKKDWPKASNGVADCSQIAKEADDLVFLVPGAPSPKDDPRMEVNAWIAKNRAGPKNIAIPLMFRGDRFRFIDPNEPGPYSNPSRQYVDTKPDDADDVPAPPPGRFDDDGADTLTGGL